MTRYVRRYISACPAYIYDKIHRDKYKSIMANRKRSYGKDIERKESNWFTKLYIVVQNDPKEGKRQLDHNLYIQ